MMNTGASAENQLLLKIRNLELKTPDGRLLLKDFQLDVGAGDVVFIQGGNGSGKTTLIRCVLGVWPHYRGNVELTLSDDEIAYLPQIQSPEVHMPLNIRDVLSTSTSAFSEEKVISLGLLGEEQLSINWNTASGGEKKRALLTLMLLNQPKAIFLDEPFNHLDNGSHELIRQCLKNFVIKQFGTLILVSHDETGTDFFDDLPVREVRI